MKYAVIGNKTNGSSFWVSRARSGEFMTPHKTVRRHMTRAEAERLALHLNQLHTGTYDAQGRYQAPLVAQGWSDFDVCRTH